MKRFFSESFGFIEKLKNRDLGLRLFIGVICFLCLAIFLHFREVKVETLELDTRSDRYIVAQVDFEFPDHEVMFILKQEAIQAIGPIYQIDNNVLKQVHYDLENVLEHDKSWKQSLKNTNVHEIYKVADTAKYVLEKAKFTDSITRRNIEKYDIPLDNFFTYSPRLKENNILSVGRWNSDILQKAISVRLPHVKKEVIVFVSDYFAKHPYSLRRDAEGEERIKSEVSGFIPQKYTKINSGTKIIGQGERVLSKHIVMLQSMKHELNKKRLLFSPFIIIGNILLSFIFVALSFLYLKIDQQEILVSVRKLSLFVCIIILTLTFAKIVEYLILQNPTTLLDAIRYPLIVPFAAILLLMLFNSRIALYGASFLSIVLAATLAVDHSRFLILNLITSLVVIVSTKSLRRRKEVFEVCGKCLLGAIPVILAFNFITIDLGRMNIVPDIVIAIIFMLITAILVVGLLPLLESLFHIMTDITIMEYMDPNNELLKRLTLEMPGTYQHSLVLGNLSEISAQAIGARGLLCRVATLYHDIGKLANSNFFTENQQMGMNIHHLLTPEESAKVIISHVEDGVNIAKKYRLPKPFIDIIKEHHGTMLVYYFYRKELDSQNGDKSKIDEDKFRYKGPKPASKESAIIMISDGVEAASRSENKFTQEEVEKLVNKVVKERLDDEQFDECDLTFADLKLIKSTLVKTLIATHHVRIKYPEKED